MYSDVCTSRASCYTCRCMFRSRWVPYVERRPDVSLGNATAVGGEPALAERGAQLLPAVDAFFDSGRKLHRAEQILSRVGPHVRHHNL